MTDSQTAPTRPGPPLWLLAELTYDCPLHCAYCSNPMAMGRKADELDTEGWLSVLTQARAMGAVQLGFSGGEPLLRSDLEPLVAHARELGFYSNLITSGIGLNLRRIERLKAAGLDHIQISFQAADPTLADAIAGRGKAFEHKLAMSQAVKAAGFPMVLNFVVSRQNIEQIDDIMRLCCDLQADYVELATTQYYGWAWHNRDHLLPDKAQLVAAEARVNAFRQRLDGQGPKIIFVTPDYYEGRPKACMNGWGSTFINIAPDGTAMPCHSAAILPIELPKVTDLPLEQIWYRHDAFNRFRGYDWMQAPCAGCEEKSADFGGCRCQAYLMTGDMYAADPVCAKSSERHRVDGYIERAGKPDRALRHRVNTEDIVRVRL